MKIQLSPSLVLLILTFLIFIAAKAFSAQDVGDQLVAAAGRGDLAALRSGLTGVVDPEETDYVEPTELLLIASEKGKVETVQYLLSVGAEIGAVLDNETVLMRAARKGHTEVIRLLVHQGADVDQRTLQGTALGYAAESNQVEAARILIAAHADLNRKDACQRTPLMRAAMKGRRDMVKLLVEKGADPVVEGWRGWTALRYAASWGRADVVRMLLEGTKNRNGPRVIQALGDAARGGHTETVAVFAELGVDLNAPDLDGYLPLAEAAEKGHIATVNLLRAKGARPVPPPVRNGGTVVAAVTR